MRGRLGLSTMALILLLMPLAAAQAEVITFDHHGQQAGFELIQQSAQGMELKFRLEQLRLEDLEVEGTLYQQVSIPGVFLPSQSGAPNLPSFGRMVALPNGALAHLEVIGTRREKIKGIDVLPAAPIPLETDDSPPLYTPDPTIYGRDAYWPEQIVQVSDRKQMRGVDAVVLGISPFQYNPIRKELIVFSEIHLRLDFEGGIGKFGVDRLRSRGWDSILRQHLLNFDSLPVLESIASMDGVTPEGEYQYVIITPDDPIYIEQAERLRDFRIEQGISTGVVTLTETGTTAAEIEAWIDDAYANWQTAPEAVLLLADWTPDGGTDGITCAEYNDYCVSDNFYADVDEDHLPDIVLARITATPDNIERMVSKVIDYELAPPTTPSFYDNPLLACGWQDDRWFCLCSEIVHGFLDKVLSRSPVREYVGGTAGMDEWSTNPNTWMLVDYFGPTGLEYIPETPEYLVDWSGDADGISEAINNGAFITQHRDHGGTLGWSHPQYLIDDLSGLYNQDLTYVFSMNCLTGKFDASDEVFAEAFHRMEDGALGVIAATQISYSFVNDALIFGLWDYMWPIFDPGYGPGGSVDPRPAFALASAKYYLRDSVWPYNPERKELTYHLFHAHGDAYTMLYTEIPQELTVESWEVLPIGSQTFGVRADEGATIALSFDGRILGVEQATGGWQEMEILPVAEEGDATLTVTMANHYRHSTSIPAFEPCTYEIAPSGLPIQQESGVQVTVWDETGQLASDVTVSIDGWGIDEVNGVTDGSGEVSLDVLPPYGESLIVRGKQAGKGYYCFSGDLPVSGGSDFGSAAVAVSAPVVNLSGMLTPGFEGFLEASASESEFTFYARGCGVDAITFSGASSTADLVVLPVDVGLIEAVMAKPGFNVFEQLVAVERVYGTVSGTVRDAQGDPLEDALVQYYPSGAIPGQDLPFAQQKTDASGGYSFADPQVVAHWNAYVTKFGYDPLLLDVIVQAGTNTIDFTVLDAPRGILSGTVADAGTGESVEGWIEIYRTDNSSLYTTVTSDAATGYYEVELPYFDYEIVAESVSHFPTAEQLTVDQPTATLDFSLANSFAGVLIIDNYSSIPTTSGSASRIEEALIAMGGKVRFEHYLDTDPSTWWDYEVVVWSTSSAPTPLTSEEHRAVLRNHLVGGGRLLLESANVANSATLNNREDWFFSDVLHADYVAPSNGELELSATSHVLATTPNNLGDIGPFEDYIDDDVVDPRSDAELVYTWTDYPAGSGVLVWDDDPDPDHGNLVYMSFDYRDIEVEEREKLLENIFHYLVNREGATPELGDIAGTALLDGESDHSGISISTVPSSVSTTTATDGSYELSNVPVGTYDVVASKDDWTDDQVDGVEVEADQTTSGIDFLLYAVTTNEPPVAENQQVSTKLNRSVVIELEAEDPDGDPLTYICVDFPDNGTLSGCDDGDEYVTYSPDNQFTGNDTFTFKANDGLLDSNEATVTVKVAKGGGGGGKPTDGVKTLELNPRDGVTTLRLF